MGRSLVRSPGRWDETSLFLSVSGEEIDDMVDSFRSGSRGAQRTSLSRSPIIDDDEDDGSRNAANHAAQWKATQRQRKRDIAHCREDEEEKAARNEEGKGKEKKRPEGKTKKKSATRPFSSQQSTNEKGGAVGAAGRVHLLFSFSFPSWNCGIILLERRLSVGAFRIAFIRFEVTELGTREGIGFLGCFCY